MAKTRAERIESIKEEITQHQNQIKRLLQAQRAQGRKDRTRRLCERMGLFESMLPAQYTTLKKATGFGAERKVQEIDR